MEDLKLSRPEEEDKGSWLYGIAQCFDCGYEWVAVWPLGADRLQCYHCHGFNTQRQADPDVDVQALMGEQ